MLWSKDTRFIRWLPCEAKEYKVYKGTQTTLFTVRRGLKWHTHGAHSVVRGKRDPLARRINLVATRIDLKTTFPIQATDIYVLLMKCPKCPQKIVAQNSRMIPRFVPSPPLYIEQPLTSSPVIKIFGAPHPLRSLEYHGQASGFPRAPTRARGKPKQGTGEAGLVGELKEAWQYSGPSMGLYGWERVLHMEPDGGGDAEFQEVEGWLKQFAANPPLSSKRIRRFGTSPPPTLNAQGARKISPDITRPGLELKWVLPALRVNDTMQTSFEVSLVRSLQD
ncbi:hypothetical protein F5887DRAFT_923289 [Amanita rubescens]|nr:hypothetical protein F5887DRAFT_923289 [Amanita rubescens]